MRILSISCLLLLTTACAFTGRNRQKKQDNKPTPTEQPADVPKPDEEKGGELPEGVLAQFKADYKNEPVEVVVVVEDKPAFAAAATKITYAADSLAARMAFTSLDFRLTVVGIGSSGAATGAAVRTGDGEGSFLVPSTKGLRQKVVGRLIKAPPTSTTTLSADIFYAEAAEYFASDVFLSTLRPNAWLAVLVVQGSPSSDTSALQSALEAANGKNYSVSALGLFEGDLEKYPGCTTETPENKDLADLVDTTQGVRASLCQPSYASYFSDWLIDASLTRSFATEIAKGLDSGKMRVEAGGSFISNWSYDETTGILTLPRVIAVGTEVVVRSTETATSPSTVKDPTDPTKPAEPTPESPELKKFNAEINPLLVKNCGGCHGAGGGYTQYVGNFELVKQRKAQLLERLQLPAGDQKRMPPNGIAAPAELQALIAYLTSL